jgi:hypothetical protein
MRPVKGVRRSAPLCECPHIFYHIRDRHRRYFYDHMGIVDYVKAFALAAGIFSQRSDGHSSGQPVAAALDAQFENFHFSVIAGVGHGKAGRDILFQPVLELVKFEEKHGDITQIGSLLALLGKSWVVFGRFFKGPSPSVFDAPFF